MTTLLRRRGVLLFAAFLAADAGIAVAACSTSSPEVETADATAEATPGTDAAKDAPPVITPEAGKDGGGVNCEHVKGACDIVLQDCPAQQECVVNNSNKTECRAVQVSQQLGIGRGCCPNGSSNSCLPGLSCIGNDCVDGSAPTARCSPACCPGDDQKCGKSDPEGISGACDLKLVGQGDVELHNVCTYRPRCKPFKEEPCKTGETCLVEDKVGTSSCVTVFSAPGKTNRQACTVSNDCADGLQCYFQGDAGVGSCRYVCLFPGSSHPFDAGVQEGGAGQGGCPAGEKCGTIQFSNRPTWYSLCALTSDGG
jgi:hypothetical protein